MPTPTLTNPPTAALNFAKVATSIEFAVMLSDGQIYTRSADILVPLGSAADMQSYIQRYINYESYQLRLQTGEVGLIAPPLP